jgi:hypothetical protein
MYASKCCVSCHLCDGFLNYTILKIFIKLYSIFDLVVKSYLFFDGK